VKGKGVGNGFGPEGAGVFIFVDQFYSPHPDAVVVEIEFLGVVDGMTDLDSVSDVGRRRLIDVAFEADGGIIIDNPFVAH